MYKVLGSFCSPRPPCVLSGAPDEHSSAAPEPTTPQAQRCHGRYTPSQVLDTELVAAPCLRGFAIFSNLFNSWRPLCARNCENLRPLAART